MSDVKVSEIVSVCLARFGVSHEDVMARHLKRGNPADARVLALGAVVYLARRHTRATYLNIADSVLKGLEKPHDLTRLVEREHEFGRRIGWSLRLRKVVDVIEEEIDAIHERRTLAKEQTVASLQAIATRRVNNGAASD